MFEGTELESITFSTDHTSDLNELQKIVETEILTDSFSQRRLPEGTFDEDSCVICYDDMDIGREGGSRRTNLRAKI